MNSAYSVTNIFIPLIPLEQAIFPRGRAPHEKRFVIHVDNCSVHTGRVSTDWLEEHSILRIPHPLYSPDLASSDFYLFLTVKEKLEWIQLADEDQCFECPQEILKDIDLEELNTVFQTWVCRVQEVSEGNGATSDDEQFLYKSSARSYQTGLAHIFIDQTIGATI
jgi:hypothetical protein